MNIADGHLELNGRALLNGVARVIDQLVIQRLIQTVILRDQAAASDLPWNLRVVQDIRKIETTRLPMLDGCPHLNAVYAAGHFVHTAEAQLRHQLAGLFGNIENEIDDVLG